MHSRSFHPSIFSSWLNQRPCDIPDQGLLGDLLWSDPDQDIVGWGQNDRGVSYTFGPDVVSNFCRSTILI